MPGGVGAGFAPASPAPRTALARRGVAAHDRAVVVRCVNICVVCVLILLTRRCARRSRQVAANRVRHRQVIPIIRRTLVSFRLARGTLSTLAARPAPPPAGPLLSRWRITGCINRRGRVVDERLHLDRIGRVERRGNTLAGFGVGASRPLRARLPWRTRRTGDWLLLRRSLGVHGSAFRLRRARDTHHLLLAAQRPLLTGTTGLARRALLAVRTRLGGDGRRIGLVAFAAVAITGRARAPFRA